MRHVLRLPERGQRREQASSWSPARSRSGNEQRGIVAHAGVAFQRGDVGEGEQLGVQRGSARPSLVRAIERRKLPSR
jgi:hypothetical protein